MKARDPYLKELVKIYRDITNDKISEGVAEELIYEILGDVYKEWGDDL